MKHSILYVVGLIMIIGLVACKDKSDDDTVPPGVTYADLENSFNAIDISPGIEDVTLQATDNISWDIRVIAPETSGGELRPLVFALHGAYGGNTSAHQETACYVEPGLESLDAFIISPYAGQLPWFAGESQQQILTLLNLAVKFWPVDPDKIVVAGYSNGGNGSWFFAETRPEEFSAGIPIASSYSTYDTDSTGREMPVPLYVIHGENDELFPLDTTQIWVEQSIAAGSDIEFVVASGLGHYEPCEYVPYIQDAAVWLRDSIW